MNIDFSCVPSCCDTGVYKDSVYICVPKFFSNCDEIEDIDELICDMQSMNPELEFIEIEDWGDHQRVIFHKA